MVQDPGENSPRVPGATLHPRAPAASGTLSEKVKVSVTVLEFVSQ